MSQMNPFFPQHCILSSTTLHRFVPLRIKMADLINALSTAELVEYARNEFGEDETQMKVGQG